MEAKIFLKKFNLKEGDFVEAVFQGEKFLGTIIPGNEPRIVFLKLKSGYNIGLEEGKISSIKKISEGKKVSKPVTTEIKQNHSLPKILVLHTGGTIASRVNYETGGVFASFSPSDLLAIFPELAQKANFETKMVMNLLSGNMRFAHYQKIAEEIKKALEKDFSGIIIPHGTDTMAYTAAALAFMIEKPPVPILLIGAQRSSDRGSSDAAMNLSCAVDFITKTVFAGVGVCMHENESDSSCVILPPTKTRKMHSSRRDAFKAVNAQPIARIDYKTSEIRFLQNYSFFSRRTAQVFPVFKTKMEEKVGLLKSTPSLLPEQISFFAKQKFKGLIIEGTGLGHMPVLSGDSLDKTNSQNFKALQALIKKGCIVVMTTQCLYGRVDMNVYSYGRELLKIGVLDGKDMLPETALVKLAWLLGNYKEKEKIKELMQQNLRGEITERTPLDSKAPEF